MPLLTVTCPSGFTDSVLTSVGGSAANPGWGQVAVRCTGPAGSGAASNVLPAYVVSDGCPADFPMCGSGAPPSVSDTVALCALVIGAWVTVWCVRLVRRVL